MDGEENLREELLEEPSANGHRSQRVASSAQLSHAASRSVTPWYAESCRVATEDSLRDEAEVASGIAMFWWDESSALRRIQSNLHGMLALYLTIPHC